MPNWCNNFVRINGNPKSVSLIKMKVDEIRHYEHDSEGNVIKEGDNLFSTLVGLGLKEAGMTLTQYNEGGWYEHNRSRFGTKWDPTTAKFWVDDFVKDDGDGNSEIVMNITTAWSPCIPFLILLSEKYAVNIEVQSEEEGESIYLTCTISNGKVTHYEDYPYDEGVYKCDNSHFWDSVVPNAIEYAYEECDEDDYESAKEELKKQFHFVSEKDLATILGEYDEYVKEQIEC